MFGRFIRDRSGTVAILFGLMLPALLVAAGGSLEIARALEYKQRLVSATDLACWQAQQYVQGSYGDSPTKDFTSDVQSYATKNQNERNLTGATITATPTPKVKPATITVTSTGASKLIIKVAGQTSIPFTVTRTCAVDLTSSSSGGTLLLSESFESNHSVAQNGWTVLGYSSDGSSGSWNGWLTTNAGVEINGIPQLTGGTIRFGNFFAELDSDCLGSSKCTRTNSALSRKLNLTKGKTYEIRYWYTARKMGDDPYGNKAVVCSTSNTGAKRAKDISDLNNFPDSQTRRVELWVEPYDKTKTNGGYIDFSQRSGGVANSATTDYTELADVCIWADDWTERTYTFTATQTSEYRITWAAAGREDTYGGLIDYLRICQDSCS